MPIHWHGSEEPETCKHCGHEPDTWEPPKIVGGIIKSLCDQCYGLGVLQPNQSLFRQRVGKTLLWRFKEAGYGTLQEIVDRIAEHWGFEHAMAPRALFSVEEGEMPASVVYPSSLVKRVAREVSRGKYCEDGTMFRAQIVRFK